MVEAKDFRAWQQRVGLNGREVAEAFGKSADTISIYRTKGVPDREAKVIRLAMVALESGAETGSGRGPAEVLANFPTRGLDDVVVIGVVAGATMIRHSGPRDTAPALILRAMGQMGKDDED